MNDVHLSDDELYQVTWVEYVAVAICAILLLTVLGCIAWVIAS